MGGTTLKVKPFAFETFPEQTARLRLDLAANLLNSEREIWSDVRPDESSATELVTVVRGGDFASVPTPRDPPTAGKEEEEADGEALRRLAGWKKSVRVLDVDEAISVSEEINSLRRRRDPQFSNFSPISQFLIPGSWRKNSEERRVKMAGGHGTGRLEPVKRPIVHFAAVFISRTLCLNLGQFQFDRLKILHSGNVFSLNCSSSVEKNMNKRDQKTKSTLP